MERNLKIIKENIRILDSFFNKRKSQFYWIKPKAGSIAFPMIKFEQNIEDFCDNLFRNKGVLLSPGTKFDFDNKHFRIGFGRKKMPFGLKLLEQYLEEFYN